MATSGNGKGNDDWNGKVIAGRDGDGTQEDLCPACGGTGTIYRNRCEICCGGGLILRTATKPIMAERHRRIMARDQDICMHWPDYYTDMYPDFWGPPALVERATHARRRWLQLEKEERIRPHRRREEPLPHPSWQMAYRTPMLKYKPYRPGMDPCPCCTGPLPKRRPDSSCSSGSSSGSSGFGRDGAVTPEPERSSSVVIEEIPDEDEGAYGPDPVQVLKQQVDKINLEDREPAPYGGGGDTVAVLGRGRGGEAYLAEKQKALGRGRARVGRGRAAPVLGAGLAFVGADDGPVLPNAISEGATLQFIDPELREMVGQGAQLDKVGEYILKQLLLKAQGAVVPRGIGRGNPKPDLD